MGYRPPSNTFPENPDDLLPDAQRDSKGNIRPNDTTRIRVDDQGHPAEEGKPNSPRHTDPHYHVDTKPAGSGDNQFKPIRPPGYIPGMGTGFLPGEPFPGETIKIP